MKYFKYLFVTVALLSFGIALQSCSDEKSVEPAVTYDSFKIQTVASIATAADANPEIVRMVPGSDNQAAFVASATNQLFTIT